MKAVRKIVICVIAVMMILISVMSALRIHAEVFPESTDYYVNDYAEVLSDETERYLESQNASLDKGAEILVVTAEYVSSDDLETISYDLFNQWGIGSFEYNNGVLIILVTGEGKYWVTVGRGLENELSSSVLTRILDRSMEEAFDDGDYDLAVRNTFDEIYSIVSKKYGIVDGSGTPITPESPAHASSGGLNLIWIWGMLFLVFMVIIVVCVLMSIVRRNRRTIIYHTAPRPRFFMFPRPFVRPAPRDPFYRPEPPQRREEPMDRPTGNSLNSNWSSSNRRASGSSFGSANRSVSGSSRSTFGVGRSSATRTSRGGSSRGGGAGRK